MASTAHVHHETQNLPVLDHTNMLSAQFLASCLRPTHPSFQTVTAPPGPRNMKATLMQKHSADVQPFLDGDNIPSAMYNSDKNTIHTDNVCRAVASRECNRVLNAQPPDISPSISRLPCQTQWILFHLRSGFSNSLASYRQRVGRATSNLCPDCSLAPQTTGHLFECPSHPTSLTTQDLWINPIRSVVNFLASTPSFADLELTGPSLWLTKLDDALIAMKSFVNGLRPPLRWLSRPQIYPPSLQFSPPGLISACQASNRKRSRNSSKSLKSIITKHLISARKRV